MDHILTVTTDFHFGPVPLALEKTPAQLVLRDLRAATHACACLRSIQEPSQYQ